MDGNSDADLVVFLNCFSSYKDLKENRASIIKIIETELNRCHKSIAYKVDIQPPKVDDSSRRSLSLIIRSTKKTEPVEVDILPTYSVLGNLQQSLPLGSYGVGRYIQREMVLQVLKSQIIKNL